MPLYTKESLDALRQRIDLVEVLSPHIDLKRSGSAFKSLCPFHVEKTPSFIIHKGDDHYHCFGCGAHGDAIGFLMSHLKMSFTEAVEALAEKFGVVLEREGKTDHVGPSKASLKEAIQYACQFFHFMLLYTSEGHEALNYLYQRGIDLDFISRFEIGYAPHYRQALYHYLKSKNIDESILQISGLLLISEDHQRKDFFYDRIMFPIRDGMGNPIGFSGRKFKEETFGGKYINSSETPVFKKSYILFGLSYCRKTIVKEKKALIVEGQVDCLRLIQAGFDWTVTGQGTAFGEGHVQELLNLGVTTVYLALDGDQAGQEAAIKIGDLFQKKGIEVFIVPLPLNQDPDTLLCEKGPHWFSDQIKVSKDYLTFLVDRLSLIYPLNSPSNKHHLIQDINHRIQAWEHPVMVHESLKKVAELVQLPIDLLQVPLPVKTVMRNFDRPQKEIIDPDKILESDLLRLLFFSGSLMSKVAFLAKKNLQISDLKLPVCQKLYGLFLQLLDTGQTPDLLSCAASLDSEEETIIRDMMERKVHIERIEASFITTIRSILQRNWMEKRENIKLQLLNGNLSEDEALHLAKEFDVLKRQIPEVSEI